MQSRISSDDRDVGALSASADFQIGFIFRSLRDFAFSTEKPTWLLHVSRSRRNLSLASRAAITRYVPTVFSLSCCGDRFAATANIRTIVACRTKRGDAC